MHWRVWLVIAEGETGPRTTQRADLEGFEHRQVTRLTCATADPNCCHLGCTARRRGNQAAIPLAGLGSLGPLS
jgi:hypothetical protein